MAKRSICGCTNGRACEGGCLGRTTVIDLILRGEGKISDYKYFTKRSGKEVVLDYIRFHKGELREGANDYAKAKELYSHGWKIGSMHRPGEVRITYADSRREFPVDPRKIFAVKKESASVA